MHKLEELKEKLIEELEDYAQNGKFSKEDVESIKYMTSAVDHLCNIIEEYEDEGYSGAGMYEGEGGRGDGRSYARGNGRGRGRNARRDAMGRYSGNEVYSRAMDDMTMELRQMMDDAPNEDVKREFKRFLNKIETM